MFRSGIVPLLIALALFSIFFGNVAIGAADGQVFLTDVQEMLTLFASALFFVMGVLLREAKAKAENPDGIE